MNISIETVKKLSPDAYSILNLSQTKKLFLFEKIFSHGSLSKWKANLEFSREFNASDDDFRFNSKGSGYRIYEGKMFWALQSILC